MIPIAGYMPWKSWLMFPNHWIKISIWLFDSNWAPNVDNRLSRSIFAFSSMIYDFFKLTSMFQSWSLFKNVLLVSSLKSDYRSATYNSSWKANDVKCSFTSPKVRATWINLLLHHPLTSISTCPWQLAISS